MIIPENLVTYDEKGYIASAMLEFEGKEEDNPVVVIPVKRPISLTIERTGPFSYADVASTYLLYRKVIKPFMTGGNYISVMKDGWIHEPAKIQYKYIYTLDLNHLVKYHGYVLK
jgi:hypothetical protein